MEEQLLELVNKNGIVDYTFVIIFGSLIFFSIYNIFLNLGSFIYQKAMYYYDKRKELKKNGS